MMRRFNLKLSYTQSIAVGFIAIILIGAALLSLPIASRSGAWTPPLDALFTATSATCVTGLVLFDTYTHWSTLGQIIIMMLMQVGGVGFMTVITVFSLFRRRKIGLYERQLLVQSTGMLKLSGIIMIIKRIILGVLCFELVGAVLLAFRFCRQMGLWRGVFYAVFHSISAFCNTGFDLMGRYEQFSSLTNYANDPLVSLTVIILAIIGSIGFMVWNDIANYKWRFRKYSLHSRIVLVATFVLVGVSWILYYVFESGGALSELSGPNKAIAALFQAGASRTSGFNTVDTAGLSESGSFLTVVLMFIGGSSGSTSGGIKVTTVVVLLLTAIASARRMRHVTISKRRIDDSLVRDAGAFFTVYLTVVTVAVIALCAFEQFSLKEGLFEVVSALGTVGLTMNASHTVGMPARTIIMLLMFIGKVGWITLIIAIAGRHLERPTEMAPEKVLIG